MTDSTLQDVRQILQQGDRQAALSLVDQILSAAPSAEGWTLAAEIVEAETDKIKCLDQALALDPNYEPARKMYSALGKLPPPRRAQPAPAAASRPDESQADEPRVISRVGEQTVYEEGIYEMLWDCKYCGTTKLLGKTHKFCPVCGAQQDASWRYFPSDEEKIAVRDHVYVGADKVCPACNSLVAGNAEFCGRCGAPQTAAAEVKRQASREAAGGQKFEREDLVARQMAETYGPPKTKVKPSRPKWVPFVIGAVVLGVIAFALFAIFAKREQTGYVTAFNWERTINIERFSAVAGSGLCSVMPADAYSVSRSYEQVGSRQVPDGEDCSMRQVDLGDGTFRQERVCVPRYRSEPVYDYVCSYMVNRWGYSRSANASGAREQTPAWPDPRLNTSTAGGCTSTFPSLGCERESGRDERYMITLKTGEDDTYQCDIPFEVWNDLPVEASFKFKVSIVGNRPDCGSLERQN